MVGLLQEACLSRVAVVEVVLAEESEESVESVEATEEGKEVPGDIQAPTTMMMMMFLAVEALLFDPGEAVAVVPEAGEEVLSWAEDPVWEHQQELVLEPFHLEEEHLLEVMEASVDGEA